MEAAGQRRFLGAVLMSYAKQGDLTGALSLIKQLKEERLASSSQRPSAQQGQQRPPAESEPAEGAGRYTAEQAPGEEEPLRHDGGGAERLDKQWSAGEGMRYLLLYTQVEQLYK